MASTENKSTTPETEEWVTVSDQSALSQEIKMVFEVIGDEFVGIWEGFRTIPSPDGGFKQARFSDEGGETYFVNANYSLADGLANVRLKSKVRITYIADLDTGQANPMRVYKVDVARAARGPVRTGGIRPGNPTTNT